MEKEIYCRNCGSPIEEGFKHCKTCGFKIEDGNKFCFSCGKNLESFGHIHKCPFCKQTLIERPMTIIDSKENIKSMLVAGLLQTLCPFFALGRFYLGYYKVALLQVLATVITFGFGILWPFIDGLLILNGKLKKDAFGRDLID